MSLQRRRHCCGHCSPQVLQLSNPPQLPTGMLSGSLNIRRTMTDVVKSTMYKIFSQHSWMKALIHDVAHYEIQLVFSILIPKISVIFLYSPS